MSVFDWLYWGVFDEFFSVQIDVFDYDVDLSFFYYFVLM